MSVKLLLNDNEWPYPDGDNTRVMQDWWNRDQARWREFSSAPSQIDLFWDWLYEEDLLDGVIIPEWALAQERERRMSRS